MPAELVMLGTFLPILAVLATAVLASLAKGPWRWRILVVLPGAFLGLCWWVAPAVLDNGNLLAAVLYIAYYAGLFLYYPALLVAALVARFRQRTAG